MWVKLWLDSTYMQCPAPISTNQLQSWGWHPMLPLSLSGFIPEVCEIVGRKKIGSLSFRSKRVGGLDKSEWLRLQWDEWLLFWYFNAVVVVVVVLIKIVLVKAEEWLGCDALSTRSNNKTVYLKMDIKIKNDGERILVQLEAKEVKLDGGWEVGLDVRAYWRHWC